MLVLLWDLPVHSQGERMISERAGTTRIFMGVCAGGGWLSRVYKLSSLRSVLSALWQLLCRQLQYVTFFIYVSAGVDGCQSVSLCQRVMPYGVCLLYTSDAADE